MYRDRSLKWQNITYRSSRPDVFCKKGVPRNFTKFTGKHLCQSLFFNKVAGLRPENLWWLLPHITNIKILKTFLLDLTFKDNAKHSFGSPHRCSINRCSERSLKFYRRAAAWSPSIRKNVSWDVNTKGLHGMCYLVNFAKIFRYFFLSTYKLFLKVWGCFKFHSMIHLVPAQIGCIRNRRKVIYLAFGDL